VILRFLKVCIKEVIYTFFLIVGVTTLLFLLFYLMPGKPAMISFDITEYLGLLKRLFTFNYGISIISGRDINDIIFPAFKNTLILTTGSIFISLLIAVPIGIFSAFKGFKSFSWPLSLLSYVISSMPVFYLGYVTIYLFSRYTGFLPVYYSPGLERGKPVITYLLPILVLGFGNDSISEIVRLITNELGRVISTDYVISSKGRGESVLRSSVREGVIIPIVSIVFSKIPFLIGGAVIVEYVFNWPGMGRLAFQATLDRDMPVLIVIAFLSVIFVRVGMILKDLILYYVNPGEK